MKILLFPRDLKWEEKLQRQTGYTFIDVDDENDLIGRKSIEEVFLIPRTDQFAAHLSLNQRSFRENNYKFVTSEYKLIDQLANKVKLSNHVLQSYLPKKYNFDDVKYPCYLKYEYGHYSETVWKVNNYSELSKKTKNLILDKDYVIQEAVPGNKEYSTSFIVDRGSIVFSAGYFHSYSTDLFVWPYDKADAFARFKLNKNSSLIKIFQEFLTDYHGIINCNYKIIGGKPKILEFNPRLSGDIFHITRRELNYMIKLYCKISTDFNPETMNLKPVH